MSTDTDTDDGLPCISAVGIALIALEKEIAELEHESIMLHRKLAHITAKQRICTSTIKRILERSTLLYEV